MDIGAFLGSNLRRIRGKRSQETFAALMGIDQSTLSQWEAGNRSKHLQKLVDALQEAGEDPMRLFDAEVSSESAEDFDRVREILRLTHELAPETQEAILALVRSLNGAVTEPDTEAAALLSLLREVDPAMRTGIVDAVRALVQGATSRVQ